MIWHRGKVEHKEINYGGEHNEMQLQHSRVAQIITQDGNLADVGFEIRHYQNKGTHKVKSIQMTPSINLPPAEIYQTSTGKYIELQLLAMFVKYETDSVGQK